MLLGLTGPQGLTSYTCTAIPFEHDPVDRKIMVCVVDGSTCTQTINFHVQFTGHHEL